MKTTKSLLILALLFYSAAHVTTALANQPPAQKTLNFVVALPAPASRIHKVWGPFVAYLESRTNTKINLLTPKGLDKLESMLSKQEVDFIYVNSYTHYLMKQKGLLNAIAQMRNKEGEVASRGRIFVRKDSNIKSIEDLRGGSISLISPYGAGSYLAPKAFFSDNDLELDEDIKIKYSKDLKKSVYDVLLKETDAAVMCGVNYEIINKKIDMQDIYVLELTSSFPEAVIAAHPSLNDSLKTELTGIITKMSEDFGGRQALIRLRNTKIYDFVQYDIVAEEKIKNLMQKANL